MFDDLRSPYMSGLMYDAMQVKAGAKTKARIERCKANIRLDQNPGRLATLSIDKAGICFLIGPPHRPGQVQRTAIRNLLARGLWVIAWDYPLDAVRGTCIARLSFTRNRDGV